LIPNPTVCGKDHTCGGIQGFDELLGGISKQPPHSINNPHGLSLSRKSWRKTHKIVPEKCKELNTWSGLIP
jgi:hypothetical protein